LADFLNGEQRTVDSVGEQSGVRLGLHGGGVTRCWYPVFWLERLVCAHASQAAVVPCLVGKYGVFSGESESERERERIEKCYGSL
jgi:hypothetical protein